MIIVWKSLIGSLSQCLNLMIFLKVWMRMFTRVNIFAETAYLSPPPLCNVIPLDWRKFESCTFQILPNRLIDNKEVCKNTLTKTIYRTLILPKMLECLIYSPGGFCQNIYPWISISINVSGKFGQKWSALPKDKQFKRSGL